MNYRLIKRTDRKQILDNTYCMISFTCNLELVLHAGSAHSETFAAVNSWQDSVLVMLPFLVWVMFTAGVYFCERQHSPLMNYVHLIYKNTTFHLFILNSCLFKQFGHDGT